MKKLHKRYFISKTSLTYKLPFCSFSHSSYHCTHIFMTLEVLKEFYSWPLWQNSSCYIIKVKKEVTFTLVAFYCKSFVCLAQVQSFLQKIILHIRENWKTERQKCGTNKCIAIGKSVRHLMGLQLQIDQIAGAT